jgi:maleylacetate reductase
VTDGASPLRAAMLAGDGFTVAPWPTRVRFGAGAFDELPGVVDDFEARRVLLIASAGRAALVDRAAMLLGERLAGVEGRVAMHVPAAVAESVHADAVRLRVDLVVAVGGGSAIGMAKAIARAGGPPCIAVPTTYSGSEMTPIWGLTRDGAKETGRDERVRPRAVIYDPLLTLDLPPSVSGPSAINAMAHAIEALYAHDTNPLVAMFAADALRALVANTARVVRDPSDLAARTETLYGAWLAGFALGACTMGLHHKLCHVLGGSFGLPHAETHAVMLPYTVAYNASAAPLAMAAAASAMSGDDAPAALFRLTRGILTLAGAPASLRALGLPRDALPHVVEQATARPYPNPRALDKTALSEMLERAWDGRP